MATKNKHIIGINTLFLIPNEVGGTEYHLRSFLNELERIDTSNSYVVFCNKENAHTFAFTSNRWKKIILPVHAKNRILRLVVEQTLLPLLVQLYKCTHLHSYGYFGPLWGRFKKIVTIHDANWIDFPGDTSKLQNTALNFLISNSIKSAHILVTDSDFSYSRLVMHFPNIDDKLHIVYPGLDPALKNLLHKRQLAGNAQPYILSVSAFYPHKKIPYLLKLWESVSKRYQTYRLVLIGRHGLDELAIKKFCDAHSNVIWKSKVSLKELAHYYKQSKAFVFPSIYEGFGYPVYEALYAGIPVIVGNTQLYHPAIQKNLISLDFNLKNDASILSDVLNKPFRVKPKMKFFDYARAAKETILLYDF